MRKVSTDRAFRERMGVETLQVLAGQTKSEQEAACGRLPAWLIKITGRVPPGQFVRYLMVGTWNTLFGYGLYSLFTALLTPRLRFAYIYASVFSNAISITVAYLGYKFFVFKTEGNYLREWLRCILVYGSGMLPGLLLLPLLVGALHHALHLERSAPYIAGAMITGLTAIYSFMGHKHFSFRVPADAANDAADPAAAAAPGHLQQVAAGVVEEEREAG